MKEDTRMRLVDVVRKAHKLGWVDHDGNNLVMLMEDVEKTLIGILEPEYIDNLIKIKKKFDEDTSRSETAQ